MNHEKYKELNIYLNDIALYLQTNDFFFTNNIINICEANDDFYQHFYEFDFEKNYEENHLTFEEVFFLAREILESINPDYLPLFDKLIQTGELDFDYDSELDDSYFTHTDDGINVHNFIDINREFNYTDVCSLIHEFFHYLNGRGKTTINRHLLTEFISIYFENYAIDYLIKKGIPKTEIDYTMRLYSTFERAANFYYVETPLICYFTFGSIDDNSFDMLKKHIIALKKDVFDQECNNLLNYFHRKEKYLEMNELEYDEEYLPEEFGLDFSKNYRYFIGTLMAFYARSNCQMADILYLNEHVNDDDTIDLVDFLGKAYIDLNDDTFLDKAFKSIEQYINDYHISKKEK